MSNSLLMLFFLIMLHFMAIYSVYISYILSPNNFKYTGYSVYLLPGMWQTWFSFFNELTILTLFGTKYSRSNPNVKVLHKRNLIQSVAFFVISL